MKIRTLLDKAFVRKAYRDLFNSEIGQVVLADMLRQGFVFTTTYVRNDPIETAHREGMRRFVMSVARNARIGDENIQQLMDEINDHSTDKARN